MLKSFARAAAFLAYLAITLEMLFMVTPFALYYYSFYSPLLAGPSSLRVIAWLPAFFLPHLSTAILPSLGGFFLLLGLVGFFLSAFQLYYAKFRQRGVAQGGFYKRIRHPQYLFLGLAGLGLLEAKSVESRNAMERSTASKYSELPCFCQVNRADAWCGDCSVGYGGIEHDCSFFTVSL